MKVLENRVIDIGNEQTRLNNCFDLILNDNAINKHSKEVKTQLTSLSTRTLVIENNYQTLASTIKEQQDTLDKLVTKSSVSSGERQHLKQLFDQLQSNYERVLSGISQMNGQLMH